VRVYRSERVWGSPSRDMSVTLGRHPAAASFGKVFAAFVHHGLAIGGQWFWRRFIFPGPVSWAHGHPPRGFFSASLPASAPVVVPVGTGLFGKCPRATTSSVIGQARDAALPLFFVWL